MPPTVNIYLPKLRIYGGVGKWVDRLLLE